MSQIIAAGDDGTRLNDEELRATAGLVLAAGFETTVNLLGNGIRILLEHPDQLAMLRETPELWPGAVEEILRLESPVQLSARIARVDTEVAGHPIAAGELVILYLAGANRDPEVFDDPHRFDVTRDNAGKHLSFSGGRHFCLGAALARAEGEVGLRTFFERYPDAQLAGDGSRRDTRVLARVVDVADHARRGARGGTFVGVDFRATLLGETRALGDVIRAADPGDSGVVLPRLDDEPAAQTRGRGNRWSAQIIAERRIEPLDPREVRDGKPPEDPDGAIDWLNAAPSWSSTRSTASGPRPGCGRSPGRGPRGGGSAAGVHEATVHRADAVLAVGGDFELPAELAADGVYGVDRPGDVGGRPTIRRCGAGSRCTCTPPTTGSVRRGSGRSPTTRTACSGRTTTARATSRSGAGPSTCCWR